MTLLEAAKDALPVMKEALEAGYNEGQTAHPSECLEYLVLESAVKGEKSLADKIRSWIKHEREHLDEGGDSWLMLDQLEIFLEEAS